MNREEFIRIYYRQYKILEKKFIDISEYVDLSSKNYAVFSNHFVDMFLSICSEIDSLADEFCKMLYGEKSSGFSGIIVKLEKILETYPRLRQYRVETLPPYEKMNFVPFAKFEPKATTWWTDYNAVKHNRSEKDGERYNFEKANLKNVLFALSALFILIMKIDEKLSETYNSDYKITSELFELEVFL